MQRIYFMAAKRKYSEVCRVLKKFELKLISLSLHVFIYEVLLIHTALAV